MGARTSFRGLGLIALLGASLLAGAVALRSGPPTASRRIPAPPAAESATPVESAADVALAAPAIPAPGPKAPRAAPPAPALAALSPLPSSPAPEIVEEDDPMAGVDVPGFEAPGLPFAPSGPPDFSSPAAASGERILGNELAPPPPPPAVPPMPSSQDFRAPPPTGPEAPQMEAVYGSGTAPASVSANGASYTAQKTLASMVTSDIRNLAISLGDDPVRILDHLRNKYDFDPTYAGWMKGPQETFFAKGGNAYDLSALLVAMLRSSGKQARFVRRWVDVPGPTLAAWTGMEAVQGAVDMLNASGVQIEYLWIWNATAAKWELGARFPHVWAELLVSGVWKTLDPSFKSYTVVKGKNVAALAGLTGSGFNTELRAAATGNETTGTVETVNVEKMLDIVRRRRDKIHAYLRNSAPTTTGRQLMGTKTLVVKTVTALPSAQALAGAYTAERFDEIPVADQHGVEIHLNGIRVGLRLPETLHHRFSFCGVGENATEASKISAAGGLLRIDPATTRLKFELRVGGSPVASSYGGYLGDRHSITLDYLRGAGFEARATHSVTLGGVFSLVLANSRVPLEKIKRSRNRLGSAISANKYPLDETFAAEGLHATGLAYWKYLDVVNDYLGGSQNAVRTRRVSGGILGIDVARDTAPRPKVYVLSRYIDIGRDSGWVFDRAKGQTFNSWPLLCVLGFAESGMEHVVWNMAWGHPAISTMQALREAAENDSPIRGFGPSNADAVIPSLGLSASENTHIRERLAQGRRILIPTDTMKVGDWRGRGYVSHNRATGSAGHYVLVRYGGGVGRWGTRGMSPAQQEAILKKEGGWLKAFVDGAVVGDFDKRPYDTTGSNIAHGTGQFLSGLAVYGDVRDALANAKLIYDSGGSDGKLDFALSLLGAVPVLGDLVKGGKTAATVGEAALKNADELAAASGRLGRSVDDAADIVDDLARAADDVPDVAVRDGVLDISGATSHSTVNGIDVETIHVNDVDELFNRLGLSMTDGSTAHRGLVGEKTADLVAADRGWTFFSSVNKSPTAPGIDRVYKDGDRYVVVEVKFMEGDANLTKSRLNTTVDNAPELELSNTWLNKGDGANDAIQRSVDSRALTPAQAEELRDAMAAGKVDKEVIVLKNNMDGKTISPRIGSNPDLGTGSSAPVKVTILEISKTLPPPVIVQ